MNGAPRAGPSDRSVVARVRRVVAGLGRRLTPRREGRRDRTRPAGATAPERTGEPALTGDGSRTDAPMPAEEHVVQLVAENGGEMAQSEIVDALSWSESTISRKLTELERDEAVRRVQIGRGKRVFLPSAVPDGLEPAGFDVAGDRSPDG